MSYDDYKRKVIAAQEQWNKDRDWIYNTEHQGNYGTEFSGDVQPPHITTPDSYDHMDLTAMQQSVSAMKPQLVNEAVTAWANIGMTLMGTFAQFQQQFARTINGDNGHSGWRGAAATAAVDAVNNYTGKSKHLSSAATLISLKLSEMKTGLEETQSLMPGAGAPSPSGKALPTSGVMKVNDHDQQEATQEARRILATVYGRVAGQTDTGVPFLPTAPQIVSGPAPSGPMGPVGPSGPSPAPVQPGPAASGPGTGGTAPGTGPGPDQGITGPQPGTDGSASGPTNPSNPADANQPATTTAGYTAPTSPLSTSGTPGAQSVSDIAPGLGGNTPGPGGNMSGLGGSAMGAGGVPNPSAVPLGNDNMRFAVGGTTPPDIGGSAAAGGGPGRSLPGTPGAAQATAASAARTAAPRAGSQGMAGVNPGQAKGKGEGREKSGVPEYLVTKEHGEELTGIDDLPKHVPPVIGGDYDAPEY
ncbi:hypothetical protein [Nocardia alni]|uniref:hypothetical protein n=1 Tax=Nocardia alni TaxID=2815723 RepID=UPI001C215A25|nr:hypothetical protein [Nocardia alni]